tara:strand:- start:3760 stop:4515 length:756 start_codon:yes stop_codon:yes gene_type:complete
VDGVDSTVIDEIETGLISDLVEERKYSDGLRNDVLRDVNVYVHIESFKVTSHRPNEKGFMFVKNGDIVSFRAEIISEETINEVPYTFYNNGYPTGRGSTNHIEGNINLERGLNILELDMEFFHELDTLYNTGSFITVLVLDSEKKKTAGGYRGTSIYIKYPRRKAVEMSDYENIPEPVEEEYSEELFEEIIFENPQRSNLVTGGFVIEKDFEKKRKMTDEPLHFKEVFYEDISENDAIDKLMKWLNGLFEF